MFLFTRDVKMINVQTFQMWTGRMERVKMGGDKNGLKGKGFDKRSL